MDQHPLLFLLLQLLPIFLLHFILLLIIILRLLLLGIWSWYMGIWRLRRLQREVHVG